MARSFNGSSDFINCNNASTGGSLAVPQGTPITVAAWIKIGAFAGVGNQATICAKGYNGSTTCYELLQTGNNATIQFDGFNGATRGTAFNFGWATGGWHHVCGTYDGSNWKIYGDGALGSTNSISSGSCPQSNA